jgi:Flp pilus assembly pilin Flp
MTINQLLARLVRDEAGVLTFEWVLLISVLIIGIVGGLTAARDAIISELGDVAGAAVAIDQSFSVNADPWLGRNAMSFDDTSAGVGTERPGESMSVPSQTVNDVGSP